MADKDKDPIRSWVDSGKEYAEKASEQYSGMRSQVASFRDALKSSVKSGVDATNRMLATVEETTAQVRAPIVSGMQTVQEEGNKAATHLWHMYERRHEYGPHIVGGSALTMGTLTALRRKSRVAGAVSALLAGGIAYAIVYEPIPLQDLPDMVFGKKEK
ncbi:hypothetical protein ACA910_006706 [Epithemia clementina (nom. ined.)]